MLISHWNNFWYPPGNAVALGKFRCAAFTVCIFLAGYFYHQARFGYPQEFLLPAGVFLWFDLPVPPMSVLLGLQPFFFAVLIFGAAGLFTRISSAVALILSLFILGAKHNYGFPHHLESLMVLTLAILSFSPSGDGFSIDARISRQSPIQSERYFWPIRLFQVYFAFVMFSAGILKLINGGFGWLETDMLRHVLWMNRYSFYDSIQGFEARSALNDWLLAHPGVTGILSPLSLVLELAFPLVLFSRKLAPWILVSTLVMLIGVYAMLGHEFLFFFAPFFLAFLPWEKITLPGRDRS